MQQKQFLLLDIKAALHSQKSLFDFSQLLKVLIEAHIGLPSVFEKSVEVHLQ